jgi:hypothetical protein
MKRAILPLFIVALVSMGLFAGEATVTGNASISKAAEFIKVNFKVVSECYANPTDAMKANNDTVIKIQGILKKSLDPQSDIDRIYTHGGMTSKFSKTIYEGHNAVIICQNTFQQVTTVEFKSGKVAEFSKIFAIIQEDVLSNFSKKENDTEAMTYVNIQTPIPDVCEKTKKDMSLEAKEKAVEDAMANFHAYAKQCGIKGFTEIKSLNENDAIFNPQIAYERAAYDEGSVETNFKDIVQTASVTAVFKFPTTVFNCSK